MIESYRQKEWDGASAVQRRITRDRKGMLNRMKNLIVGLTGQTGAGKTTVSEYLRVNGITVIDADKVARDVVGKGSVCVADIALEFGCEYLNADGTLNRKKMAEHVFTDRAKLKRLNNVMFPYIISSINEKLDELRAKDEGIIVLDAPTLFESGVDKNCDRVVSVIAPMELRKQRIIQRDGLSEEEAIHRINSQHDDAYYGSRSWIVLKNDGDLTGLKMQTASMLARLHEILETGEEMPSEEDSGQEQAQETAEQAAE